MPDLLPQTHTWGFIGAGKMATALARGMISARTTSPSLVFAYDPVKAAAMSFASETGATILSSNHAVAEHCDILILAVKPQAMGQVLADLQPSITNRHLLISIAAGISIATLSSLIGPDRRIIRVMPNTPALIGAGASGYALGKLATPDDEVRLKTCLEAVGIAYRVPEPLLDAVTGLSGSGPAYAYLMIEALSDGGVRMGLPRDIATALAAQTLMGAARMVLETGLHPGVLKDQVTSPGGTTIAGLHAMESAGVRAALMNAVESATSRSVELGQPTEGSK